MSDDESERSDLYDKLNEIVAKYKGAHMGHVLELLAEKYDFDYDDICEEVEAMAKKKAEKWDAKIAKCSPHRPHTVAGSSIFCDYCPLIWRCEECADRARIDAKHKWPYGERMHPTTTTCEKCGTAMFWYADS